MSTETNNANGQTTAVKKFDEKTLDVIQGRITSLLSAGDIKLPANYSFENAVRSAWLHLQDAVDKSDKPVLEVCTAASISNAMLKMVVQGLSVVKSQCAFIAYGNKLTFQRQYQGSIVLAKRMSNVTDVKANAIYEKDEFVFEVNAETGVKKVVKHIQSLDTIDDESVKGAYAILTLEDGTTEHEIMTFKQIQKSWGMGGTRGTSAAHKNFAGEMACKTVITRACKLKIQASDDSDLFGDGEGNTPDPVSENVNNEIRSKAHKQSLSFDEAEIVAESKPAQAKSADQNEKIVKKEEEQPGY